MTITKLKELLENYDDDAPCCFDLWTASDVVDYFADMLPDEYPVTDEEAAETLDTMHRRRSADSGINWDHLRECAADSIKERLI